MWGTHERGVDVRHDALDETLLDVEGLEEAREARREHPVHVVEVMQADEKRVCALVSACVAA